MLTPGNIDNAEIIGSFSILLVNPEPLTPERIVAIRSDPDAVKAVRIEIGCKFFPSKYRAYAALDRTPDLEAGGYTWYKEIDNVFRCGCEKTRIDLSTLRRNLFALIGIARPPEGSALNFIPLYEKGVVSNLEVEFRALLDRDPAEEVLQKFIERNPIVLHQFPALKIFFKPKILTFFTADFAIVTPQKELLLIEIETMHTRLLR